MGWPTCNATLENESVDVEKVIWNNLTFHQIAVYISALFSLIAVLISFWLIFRHATHYLKPWEQKPIIRVLIMVPIYAVVSFLSIKYYMKSVYFEVLRDCYEAIAIASFFTLMCHYIAPDLHSQKDYFRSLKPVPWVWPVNWLQKCCGGDRGIWRTPRSGLTWFNIIWVGVFQYCFIRVACTILAVVTEYFGLYCIDSDNPAFSHVWIEMIEGICVTIAMYFLIQFYIQLRGDLSEYQPFLKILAIKLVIFLSFWQSFGISMLTSTGLVDTVQATKEGATIGYPDIKIGIPSLVLCIEMALFAILHLWAFPWQPYDIVRSAAVAAETPPDVTLDKSSYKGGFLGCKAYLDAANPWDLFKAVGRSARWLCVGRKKRELDPSYDAYKANQTGTELREAQADTAYHGSSRIPYGGSNRYERLGDDEDREPLTTHAQANPYSQPGGLTTGDIGDMRNYSSEALNTASNSRRTPGDQEIGVAMTPEDDIIYHSRGPRHHAQSSSDSYTLPQYSVEDTHQSYRPYQPYQPYQPGSSPEEHSLPYPKI